MIEVEQISKAALMLTEVEKSVTSLLGRKVRLLFIYDDGNQLSEQLIIQAVSDITGIPTPSIIGDLRTQEILFARYICISLIDKMMSLTTVVIGEIFNRDHSTVLNSLKKSEAEYITNTEYRVAFDKCLTEVIRRVK